MKRSMSGKNNPFFGRHHTERTKRILREKNSGKNSIWFGKHHTEETKLKIKSAEIKFYKNHIHHRLGVKNTKEHNEHIRLAKLREKNPMWKGDKVSKITGNNRAERWYKLKPCVRCGGKAERHHKDGNTLNNKPENIAFLCRRCHMKSDGRLDKLPKLNIYGRHK
jgi:hypothetical protein